MIVAYRGIFDEMGWWKLLDAEITHIGLVVLIATPIRARLLICCPFNPRRVKNGNLLAVILDEVLPGNGSVECVDL